MWPLWCGLPVCTAGCRRDACTTIPRASPSPRPRPVPDGAMAVDALDGVGRRRAARDDLVYEIPVAPQATLLQDAGVLGLDHDGFVKILEREPLGMVVAVLGLGDVLGEELVRQVAVHAFRSRVVGAAGPGVVLRVHDVAVGAGLRVGAEVAQALGVIEGERPHANKDAGQPGERHPECAQWQTQRASLSSTRSPPQTGPRELPAPAIGEPTTRHPRGRAVLPEMVAGWRRANNGT